MNKTNVLIVMPDLTSKEGTVLTNGAGIMVIQVESSDLSGTPEERSGNIAHVFSTVSAVKPKRKYKTKYVRDAAWKEAMGKLDVGAAHFMPKSSWIRHSPPYGAVWDLNRYSKEGKKFTASQNGQMYVFTRTA